MAFVCGCGHSGTTLVAAMLGAHPSVYAIPHETSAFINSDVDAARALFQREYLPAALGNGATLLCEKTPLHVRRLPVVRKAFPGARIVVLVRDARDVTASIKERLGSLDEAILRWNRDNVIVRHEVERGRPDLIVVFYEELIAAPEKTLMAISAHVGVDYQPVMLEFHKDAREWFAGNDAHLRFRNWQIHQPLTDRRGRWVTILSEAEASRVEQECRALMSFFGYLPPTRASAATRILGRTWREGKELLRPARRRLRRMFGKTRRRSITP